MIVPKNSEISARRVSAVGRGAAAGSKLLTEGRVVGITGKPIFRRAGDSVEVVFQIPHQEGTRLAQALGATMLTTAEAAPVSARPDMPSLQVGDLVINPGRHEVLYKGAVVPQLTFTEFGILHHLASHPGWVSSRQQIVAGVRGEDYPVTDRSIDVQVAGLRKKLGAAAAYVQTVRGVGYRFKG